MDIGFANFQSLSNASVACSPSATGDAVQILLALACSSIYMDDVACRHSTIGGGGQRQLGSLMDFEFFFQLYDTVVSS